MTQQLSRSEADIQRACLPNGIYEYMPYRYIIAPSQRKEGRSRGLGVANWVDPHGYSSGAQPCVASGGGRPDRLGRNAAPAWTLP